MTRPQTTPNPATSTRPTRSSERVAHKKPLAWLPWVALLLLFLLIGLIIYAVSEAGESGAVTTKPGAVASAAPDAGSNTSAAGTGGSAPLAAAATGALVGGAGVAPAAADNGSAGAAGSGPRLGQRAAGTAGTVLFAEGSAAIDGNGTKVIDAAAQNLKRAGATKVQVIGYTDVVAGAPVNGPLSKQRADAVAKALRTVLPTASVTTSAKGQNEPIATNSTDKGRQQNRRVAIVAAG